MWVYGEQDVGWAAEYPTSIGGWWKRLALDGRIGMGREPIIYKEQYTRAPLHRELTRIHLAFHLHVHPSSIHPCVEQ